MVHLTKGSHKSLRREGRGNRLQGHVSRRGPWGFRMQLEKVGAAVGGTVLCRPTASAGGLYSLSTFPEVKVDSVLNLTFQKYT